MESIFTVSCASVNCASVSFSFDSKSSPKFKQKNSNKAEMAN